MARAFLFPLITVSILAALCGCQQTSPPSIVTLAKAHQTFLDICEKEFPWKPVLRAMDNTVWIYVPITEAIIDTKASVPGAAPAQPVKKYNLSYLNSEYKDRTFNIDFEVAAQRRQRDLGYGSFYTQDYQKTQLNIYSAIQRAYFDVGLLPGDVTYNDPGKQSTHEALVDAHVKTDRLPDFFVVVIADVVRGLKVENLFYIEDYKKYVGGILPPDEYPKRFIGELTGGQNVIGDAAAKHVAFKEITWPEFLSRQIAARINFKYQGSSFPPGENTLNEMQKLAAESIVAYGFKDFDSLKITDLKTESTSLIGRLQLEGLYFKK